jgi:hypothetical protein
MNTPPVDDNDTRPAAGTPMRKSPVLSASAIAIAMNPAVVAKFPALALFSDLRASSGDLKEPNAITEEQIAHLLLSDVHLGDKSALRAAVSDSIGAGELSNQLIREFGADGLAMANYMKLPISAEILKEQGLSNNAADMGQTVCGPQSSPTGRLNVSGPDPQYFPGTKEAIEQSRCREEALAKGGVPFIDIDFSSIEAATFATWGSEPASK